ncbi:hypothetical protein Pelo_398 [Pelomyxa schiedti]|nr:hypothetical protein Pelo_398 [Pelomyxa schiedti]
MFPLVALASRAVLLLHSKSHCRSRHYLSIEAAAGALSPRCVAWLIQNKSSQNRGNALPLTSSASDEGYMNAEMEMDRRRRRKAKEQVAVLRGLCVGGHLKMAQRFVENGCEFWCEEGGEIDSSTAGHTKALVLWPPSSDGGGDNSFTGRSSDSVWKSWSSPLCGEFWSKRGVFHIMGEVSINGHLDVLKWLYFMQIVASTPLTAQFTINSTNLGITLDDIKDFCDANHSRDPDFSQTKWWLGQ